MLKNTKLIKKSLATESQQSCASLILFNLSGRNCLYIAHAQLKRLQSGFSASNKQDGWIGRHPGHQTVLNEVHEPHQPLGRKGLYAGKVMGLGNGNGSPHTEPIAITACPFTCPAYNPLQ